MVIGDAYVTMNKSTIYIVHVYLSHDGSARKQPFPIETHLGSVNDIISL